MEDPIDDYLDFSGFSKTIIFVENTAENLQQPDKLLGFSSGFSTTIIILENPGKSKSPLLDFLSQGKS